MPLVLTQNEMNLSDVTYTDVVGESYEFPSRYSNIIIQCGDQFVYYPGRRQADGSPQPQIYFGCGLVGEITQEVNGSAV